MAGATSSSYPVSRPSTNCAATGRAFAPGEPIVAALVTEPGVEDLRRLDFSRESWELGSRPGPPMRLFASWRCSYAPPDAKRKLRLSDDELLDLFHQLAESDQERQRGFRNVLALLLIRRKLLVYEGTVSGVLRVREATPAGTPHAPTIEVPEAKLDDESMAAVIEQLTEVIGE